MLTLKFHVLHITQALVEHPGLNEVLQSGLKRKLTLIGAAPPGFGNTTLVFVEGSEADQRLTCREQLEAGGPDGHECELGMKSVTSSL
ncbi:hypothetical protein [Deinococcus apachensis]|uniref:hypothetical protein n=1 Tax=Deinococcus apachensis TaxID=309886 RepID=UPI0012F7B009|nr:hypothetical protein [Deinococcus apachensis]